VTFCVFFARPLLITGGHSSCYGTRSLVGHGSSTSGYCEAIFSTAAAAAAAADASFFLLCSGVLLDLATSNGAILQDSFHIDSVPIHL
jgi:hypothetical protein